MVMHSIGKDKGVCHHKSGKEVVVQLLQDIFTLATSANHFNHKQLTTY